MVLVTIILILFTSLILFSIYRLNVKYLPKIYVNPKGKIFSILSKMKSLSVPYQPTPWLFNCHIHTIWGMRYRHKSTFKPTRKDIDFDDGGQVTIDYFFPSSLPEDSPLLFIVHTLGGGSREPCTNNMAAYGMKHGYRSVICSCRGCNGSKVKSKRLYNGYQTDDLHKIITVVSGEFPKAKAKFLIGFSLGSIICCQYAVDYNDVNSVISVSHSVDLELSLKQLEEPIKKKLYMPPIMKSLHRLVEKSQFLDEETKKTAKSTKTIMEYDDKLTCKSLGLNSAHEYYEKCKLEPKIDKMKIPCLFISSEDDPFSNKKFIPIDKINNSDLVAFVLTKEGGHVSFCQGFDGQSSFVEEVALDYFKCSI